MTTSAVRLAYRHTHGHGPDAGSPVPDAMCWLCGLPTGGFGVAKQQVITSAFTTGSDVRSPLSESLCIPCAWSLGGKPGRTPPPARMQGHLVSPTRYENPTRGQWRTKLLGIASMATPFGVCIPISGQKHLLFKTPLNHTHSHYRVRFEDLVVHVDQAKFVALLELIERLYGNGFSKEEIRTGRYRQHRIQAFGLHLWHATEQRLVAARGTPPFGLAVFVAHKQEGTP